MTAIPLRASYPRDGEVIDGKYRIVRVLGEGGMGMVAKADHLLRKVPVALKFIAPHILASEGGVERFLNEAVLASQIPSDHVVGILDVGKLPSGAPYMVMEYLEGRDIASLVQEAGDARIDVDLAVHLTIQILRALQAVHSVGVVHRDLKPSNCFLVQKDGDDFVKLLDFGISKAPVSAGITATNAALGTPLYMAPEQARNPKNVDGRADLYSAGVILYELLGGRTPHISESGEATEVILKLFTQDPPRIETLREGLPEGARPTGAGGASSPPPSLADVVHRALTHDVESRFKDARAFAEALAPFAPARSKHAIEKIESFVAPDKLATPMSAPDVFANLGADALAATQSASPPSISPAARTADAVAADTPAKQRSLNWILAALAAAIVVAVVVALKLAMSPVASTQPISSTPVPPTTPSIAVPLSTTILAPPPPSVSATIVTTVAPPPASASVHLKQIGIHP